MCTAISRGAKVSAHVVTSGWRLKASSLQERLGRLCRELRNLGLDLTQDLPSQVPRVQHLQGL